MATAQIEMDLFTDVASECRKQLQAAGYTPPVGDEDAVRAYLNVQHRRVTQRPRKVHKANYAVPSELIAGEQQFLDKVARGDDLRPHQSTLLTNATFDDGMLNDFGIQHFHLGTGPHPSRPGFVERTGDLLYAVVKPDDFYAIGIYTHDDWAKLEPLDIMQDRFPDVFSGSVVKGAVDLASTPTDAEVKNLRKHNVNVITKRADGTIQAPPGGGQTLGGDSVLVTFGVIKMRRMVAQTEKEVRDDLGPKIDAGALPPTVKVHLQVRGQRTFAVLNNDLGEFDLGGKLFVGPL